MGIFSSRVEYRFLDECQKHLSQLDSSLTSLASSVDAIHTTCLLLLHQLEETFNIEDTVQRPTIWILIRPHGYAELSGFIMVTRDNGDAQHTRCIDLTREILSSVEGSLSNEKMAFVEGISHFIHLLVNKADNKNLIVKHMPALQRLNIDKYIVEFYKKQKAPANMSSKPKTVNTSRNDSSKKDPKRNTFLEDMQQTVDQLRKEKASLESTVEKLQAQDVNVKETVEEYEQKLEQMSKEMASLESTVEHLQAHDVDVRETVEDYEQKLEKMTKEHNEMKTENEKLRVELEKASIRVETLPVQIYRQRRGELMDMIEEELVAMLNHRLTPENVQLEIVKCGTSTEIQPSKPLLVLCISTSRLGTDARNAIQGVVELGHTALLIFHHKDLHALPSHTSERVLAGPEFKSLRGIFDLAFLTAKGMYTCEMNTKAVESIVDFVYSVTKECREG